MKVGESERCREISKTCPIDFPVETAQPLSLFFRPKKKNLSLFFYVCKSKTKITRIRKKESKNKGWG